MKHAYIMTVACAMTWAETAVDKAPLKSAIVSALVIWWLFL